MASPISGSHNATAASGAWWPGRRRRAARSEEHTSELQSQSNLVCRLLLEKKKYFANDEHALDFMREIRWPDGVVKCPTCGSKDVSFLSTRNVCKCKQSHAKQHFSVEVGTI